MNLQLSANRIILLETLQRFDVTDSELVDWLYCRLEQVLEDVEDEIDDGDPERIESLMFHLDALNWKIGFDDKPEETERLVKWIREMEEKRKAKINAHRPQKDHVTTNFSHNVIK